MSRDEQLHTPTSRQAARMAALKMRVVANATLMAFLAVSAAACSANGANTGRPKLPVPAEFRARVSQLVGQRKLGEATAFLKETDPVLLARAASEKADTQYFAIMGIGPVIPGIDPKPRPARTWTFPGTSDIRTSREDEAYQLVAYDFAKTYNAALAKEERGVK